MLDIDFLLLLSAILFVATFIHASIGFGFALIATPIMVMVTDLQTAIIYTLFPTMLVNLMSILNEKGFLQALKKFYPLALFSMLGSAIGTQILLSTNAEILKLVLAASILGYLLLGVIKVNIPWIKQCPTCSMRAFGLGSGLLGGLTNAMGPLLLVYTLESEFSKKDSIQATNICFLSGKIVQLILFSSASAFTIEELTISLYALVPVLLALYLGFKISAKITLPLYKKIIRVLLFIIAIGLVIEYLL